MQRKAEIDHRGGPPEEGARAVRLPGASGRRGGASPIIGVTATLKEVEGPGANRLSGRFVRAELDYIDAVAEAGGMPVVLAPEVGIRAAEAILEELDGLLLSGGPDLDPVYYGEGPVPELGVTFPEWDAFEMALLEGALLRGMPVFGICRGMQILNVALGGTLYQDLPSQLGAGLLEHRQKTPKSQPTHEAELVGGSCLAEITGRRSVEVNSYHHQGIKDLAGELAVSARSLDGVIEAVESRELSERWLLGVQWHPEGMREAGPEQRDLFAAHVCAAERHHALRRRVVAA